jgi:hypothetical protein
MGRFNSGGDMSKERDDQAEIEAAKERLKGFIKRASDVNYHDPERVAAAKEGREYVPRSWRELARKFHLI